MHKIILPINTKSLYYNIFNDNEKGHTCTVATPIKQGKSLNKELNEIYKIPKQIDFIRYDQLIHELVKNSKSKIRINNVFVFDKIKVNGEIVECDANFCFFVKEEIDPQRYQFGRIKLHYPTSLKYEDLNINNRVVLDTISQMYSNYAFVIESFEYDFDTDYLNINLLLVGYGQIPYSKVFVNYKGAGSKYNKNIRNDFDVYDVEIVSLKKSYGDAVNVDNFNEYMSDAKEKAKELVLEKLRKEGKLKIRDVSKEYPYSLFDFQYYSGDKIQYALVFSSFTNKKYFNLSSEQRDFLNRFDNIKFYIVNDIYKNPVLSEINKEDLEQFSLIIDSIRYIES